MKLIRTRYKPILYLYRRFHDDLTDAECEADFLSGSADSYTNQPIHIGISRYFIPCMRLSLVGKYKRAPYHSISLLSIYRLGDWGVKCNTLQIRSQHQLQLLQELFHIKASSCS